MPSHYSIKERKCIKKNLTFVTTDLDFKINILNLRKTNRKKKKTFVKTGKNTNLKMHIIDVNPAKDIGNFGLLRDLIYVPKAQ